MYPSSIQCGWAATRPLLWRWYDVGCCHAWLSISSPVDAVKLNEIYHQVIDPPHNNLASVEVCM